MWANIAIYSNSELRYWNTTTTNCFVLLQFAADYTEKTLFKMIMVRLLKSALDENEEDLATVLNEEILHVDDQLLEIEKNTDEVSGMTL